MISEKYHFSPYFCFKQDLAYLYLRHKNWNRIRNLNVRLILIILSIRLKGPMLKDGAIRTYYNIVNYNLK